MLPDDDLELAHWKAMVHGVVFGDGGLALDLLVNVLWLQVIRCEISLDQGLAWQPADITVREKPRWAVNSSNDKARHWCWCHWELEIKVADLDGCREICFRAVDQSQNMMPERHTWNVMGMLNNPWYRVRVHKDGNAYKFEHPTLAGNDREEGWMVKMANDAPEGELRWGWGGKGTPAAPVQPSQVVQAKQYQR